MSARVSCAAWVTVLPRRSQKQQLAPVTPKHTPPVDAAQAHAFLAELCEEKGEFERALVLYRAAHDFYALALPAQHPQLAAALLNVAVVAAHIGQDARAPAESALAFLRRRSANITRRRKPRKNSFPQYSIDRTVTSISPLGRRTMALSPDFFSKERPGERRIDTDPRFRGGRFHPDPIMR